MQALGDQPAFTPHKTEAHMKKKQYWMKKIPDGIGFSLDTLKFTKNFKYQFVTTTGSINFADYEKISKSKYYSLKKKLVQSDGY